MSGPTITPTPPGTAQWRPAPTGSPGPSPTPWAAPPLATPPQVQTQRYLRDMPAAERERVLQQARTLREQLATRPAPWVEGQLMWLAAIHPDLTEYLAQPALPAPAGASMSAIAAPPTATPTARSPLESAVIEAYAERVARGESVSDAEVERALQQARQMGTATPTPTAPTTSPSWSADWRRADREAVATLGQREPDFAYGTQVPWYEFKSWLPEEQAAFKAKALGMPTPFELQQYKDELTQRRADNAYRMQQLAQQWAQQAASQAMEGWRTGFGWQLPKDVQYLPGYEPGGIADSLAGQLGVKFSPEAFRNVDYPSPQMGEQTLIPGYAIMMTLGDYAEKLGRQ